LSAFAVIYERSDMPVDPIAFNRVMERLSHRGSDGIDVVSTGHVMMGHWHFWTTPEEVGERQPLELNNSQLKIVFDGRIDNREELFGKLNITPAEGKSLSDAALVLRAFAHWREDCFKYFIGEFALVILDEARNEVICACDPLGDRVLFYAFFNTQLVIASEPWAVAGANQTKPELNESAVAHYFALRVPQDGQTFFNNIYELLPAHIMEVGANDYRLWRYWQPDPHKKIRYKTDEEYAEHFRSLLEESIHCRMRSPLKVGVLMSGGLDSTPVASLAARMIAPQILTTLSYVFDELPECDERQYIDAVKDRWKINSIQFTGDDSWTFKDWSNWPHNPNQPDRNFYRLLLENTYQRAKEEGVGVLLTGYMGDHLYSASSDWIADMVVDGQFMKAVKELIFQIKNMGWKETIKTGHLRRIARRMIDAIRPGALRLPRGKNVPAWINPDYASFFSSRQNMNPVFERNGSLLALATSNDVSSAASYTSRHGVELRNPYRDRRLVEFILAIPAYQLYSHGLLKYILRTAMLDILPEIVRTRVAKTTFEALYFLGIEKEKALFESYLKDMQAEWRKFLHANWTSEILEFTHANTIEGLLPFSCISFEVWNRCFVSEI
jgi:asparagine synthase (glutamine-hydrolysing)